MDQHTLGRSERLKSEKDISVLFEKGMNLSLQPIRIIYLVNESTDKNWLKTGFVVPKKNFKRAVDRNLLKRRMREAFRLNKHIMDAMNDGLKRIDLMLVYQGQKIEDYNKINESVKALLKKLLQRQIN